MKFRCSGIKSLEGSWKGENCIARIIEMMPVTSQENKEFVDATPSGKLEMYIANPDAADELKVGHEYFVQITDVNKLE